MKSPERFELKSRIAKRIDVRQKPGGKSHEGLLQFSGMTIPCSLGKAGIKSIKMEGDGSTPAGKYRFLYGFFRRDRLGLAQSALPLTATKQNFVWCDEPANPNYNRFSCRPLNASHEKLFREDNLYDVCLVLDCNIHPRKKNRGSAIFFHMMNGADRPTQGCVAVSAKNMERLLPSISGQTVIHIHI